MKTSRDPEMLIREFLEQGVNELPDRSYDVVRSQIDRTRQRVVFGPWREQQVTTYAKFVLAAAAVVLVAVIGFRFLPNLGGVGVQPTPTPTAAPTVGPTTVPTPSPASSPVADPNGRLDPGVTYVAHPFDTLLGVDARAFSFQVPSQNWEAHGDTGQTIGVEFNNGTADGRGVGLGFLKIHSLNSDACHWMTDEDINISATGDDPTMDELVTALQGLTTVDTVDGPHTESISNVTGQGFELTMPATLQEDDIDCDETDYRLWNGEGFDIFAQGPSNIWRLGIFDVGGELYVVMASHMPDTPDEVRNELESIFAAVAIDSSAGCPQFSTNCN